MTNVNGITIKKNISSDTTNKMVNFKPKYSTFASTAHTRSILPLGKWVIPTL